MKIQILTVDHDCGKDVYLNQNIEGSNAVLYDFVKRWWHELDIGPIDHHSEPQAIAVYFANKPDESYTQEEEEVKP